MHTEPFPKLAISAPNHPQQSRILDDGALAFIAALETRFGARRHDLLAQRTARLTLIQGGEWPDFQAETRSIRESTWNVAPLPADLLDRRVEITGPPERKMVINALNSGARCFMADFEDSLTPSWENLIDGQINLQDAIARTIDYTDPKNGKHYTLNPKPAVLMVRPRGWHLPESHVTLNGQPISGSLFDFGLYLYHNHAALRAIGSGPYFYLPKLESRFEAALWRDVFVFAEETLGLKSGTIRATVLIETILAAFEMDEILYALKDHIAALNCGRWDYIFSIIKNFAHDPAFVMPDRHLVTMTTPCMRAYSLLCIQTCHKRGALAMGGMSALIPIKGDAEANDAAMARILADKSREAQDGHDGAWVAHPALVPVAMQAFDTVLRGPNQMNVMPKRSISREDLLEVPQGAKSEAGLRANLAIGLGYLEAWLRGQGCVPLFNLMEDAATAEISRAQLWQWLHHRVVLDDGRMVTPELVKTLLDEELAAWQKRVGADAFMAGRWQLAAEKLWQMATSPDFATFLTLSAYDGILAEGL